MKGDFLASTSMSRPFAAGSGSTISTPALPEQLESILADMGRAFNVSLYYPALLIALTLPEICVGLGFTEKKTNVQMPHYVSWVKEFAPTGLGIGAETCYKLRCGLVHRADAAGHAYLGAEGVIFTVPETRQSLHGFEVQHGEGGPVAIMLDLATFLHAMDFGVRKWFAKHQSNETVKTNVRSLLSFRPNGFSPFVSGAPVVASGWANPISPV